MVQDEQDEGGCFDDEGGCFDDEGGCFDDEGGCQTYNAITKLVGEG